MSPDLGLFRVVGNDSTEARFTPSDPEAAAILEPLVLEFLREGRQVEFVVTGGSMAPFIRNNDVVVVIPVGGAPLRLGDVVVWTRGDDRLVVHRVVAFGDGGLTTRGDTMGVSDGWISREQVVGRVSAVSRGGRAFRWGLGPERRILGRISGIGLLARVLRGGAWIKRRVVSH